MSNQTERNVSLRLRARPIAEGAAKSAESAETERLRERVAELEQLRELPLDAIDDFAVTANGWFWQTDADLRFNYISPTVREIVGANPASFYGKTRADLDIAEGTSEAVWQQHLADWENRRPFENFVYSFVGRKGRRWFMSSGKPCYDDNGQFIGYRGFGKDITDEVNVKNELGDVDSAMAHLSEGFALWDIDERLVLCNDAFRHTYAEAASALAPGERLEAFLRAVAAGAHISAAVGREDDWVVERLERFRSATEPLILQNAEDRWYLERDKRLPNGRTMTLCVDITAQKAAEAEARAKNRILQMSFDNLPSMVSVKDRNGRFLMVNKAQTERMSAPAEDHIGRTGPEVYKASRSANLQQMTEQAMSTMEPIIGVERQPTVTNLGATFITSIIPIPDEAGDLEFVVTISHEVTDLKRAQLELADQKALLQQLIDTIPLEMTLKSADGRYIFVNKKLAEKHGQPTEAFIGKSPAEMFGESRAGILDSLTERVRVTGQPIIEMERTSIMGSGDVMLQSIIPIFDELGSVEKIATVTSDISKLKKAEAELESHRDFLAIMVEQRTQELAAANEELLQAEKLATIGKMIATVAHELRNPLGIIQASVQMLMEMSEAKGEKIPRAFDRIERGAKRCNLIIQELLDQTRTPELKTEMTDVDAWCASVIGDVEAPEGVEIRMTSEAGVSIEMDPDRMYQVLFNLMQNAWQAMAEKEVENPAIDLTVRRQDGYVEFIVADNGPGIPIENRSKIFEPLFSSKRHGFGFGLPLVKQLVELHKGTMELGRPTAGAEFIIRLPIPEN